MHKPVAFLYINNELSEREVKKTIPLTIASKKKKILRSRFNQGVKRPYSENYKTLMKEIEDDKNKWKDKPYSWIRKINVKMFILSEAV